MKMRAASFSSQIEPVRTGAVVPPTNGTVLARSVGIAAMGLWSYALFTGKWIFKTSHPGWGVFFALPTLWSISTVTMGTETEDK